VVLEAVSEAHNQWTAHVSKLVSLEVGHLAGASNPPMVLTLEEHYSPMDDEDGVRPYVYEVSAKGLIPKWRGTALAWPLLDMALLPKSDGVVCALHRGDSFIVPEPDSNITRVAAYRWNGFGFSGIDKQPVVRACQQLFE